MIRNVHRRSLAAIVFLLLLAPGRAGADSRDVKDWQPRTDGWSVVYTTDDVSGAATDVDHIDIESGEEGTIASGAGWQGPADIDEDYVVWVEDAEPSYPRACRARIRGRSLDSGEVAVLTDAQLLPSAPRISGNLVTWGTYGGSCAADGSVPSSPSTYGTWHIIIWNLATMQEIASLDAPGGDGSSPAIDDNRVIWAECDRCVDKSRSDLWLQHIGTGAPPEKLASDLAGGFDIGGSIVVYVGGDNHLRLVNLDDGSRRTITEDPVRNPTTDGSYVVWDQLVGEDSWELRALDLETGDHFTIDHGTFAHQPHVNVGTLVWQHDGGRVESWIEVATVDDLSALDSSQSDTSWRAFALWGGSAVLVFAISATFFRMRSHLTRRHDCSGRSASLRGAGN